MLWIKAPPVSFVAGEFAGSTGQPRLFIAAAQVPARCPAEREWQPSVVKPFR